MDIFRPGMRIGALRVAMHSPLAHKFGRWSPVWHIDCFVYIDTADPAISTLGGMKVQAAASCDLTGLTTELTPMIRGLPRPPRTARGQRS